MSLFNACVYYTSDYISFVEIIGYLEQHRIWLYLRCLGGHFQVVWGYMHSLSERNRSLEPPNRFQVTEFIIQLTLYTHSLSISVYMYACI